MCEKTKEVKTPSMSTMVLGFLSFNTFLFTSIVFNVFLLLGTYYYPQKVGLFLLLPYYSYVLVLGREERKDGWHWNAFSKNFPLFPLMRRFLAMKLVAPKELTEADKKPNAQFLLAVFPHGTNVDFRILMDGMLDSVLPNTAKQTRTLTATILFRIPLVREIALWTGCVDANRKVAEKLLQRGRSVLVLPGGQAEQIRTECGREILYLKSRKGFLKLAMTQGLPVVPVYVFGCSDHYYTLSFARSFRLWLVKSLGIAIPLAFGCWGSTTCPRPIPTTIVFGSPLQLAKPAGPPMAEQLDAAHEQFCQALTKLFDEHKHRLGYGDRTLEII